MTLLFQLILFAFIALSFLLVVGVLDVLLLQMVGRKTKVLFLQDLRYGWNWNMDTKRDTCMTPLGQGTGARQIQGCTDVACDMHVLHVGRTQKPP
jgi:hypothetical protein